MADRKFRGGMPLVSGEAKPAHRFHVALRDTAAIDVHQSNVILRLFISLTDCNLGDKFNL